MQGVYRSKTFMPFCIEGMHAFFDPNIILGSISDLCTSSKEACDTHMIENVLFHHVGMHIVPILPYPKRYGIKNMLFRLVDMHSAVQACP